MITSGELQRLIEEDDLRGITSNPAIFEKAITDNHAYDAAIHELVQQDNSAETIYETLSQQDVQSAADAFRPLCDSTNGKDGYVSLEVNPHLAHNTDGTLQEARRLWAALNRPNVFTKSRLLPPDCPPSSNLSAKALTSTSPCCLAYRAIGEPQARLEQGVAEARQVLAQLPALGIDLDQLTQQLEDEGVKKFNKPFDALLAALAQRIAYNH